MLKKIKKFFSTLFLGQEHIRPESQLKPAIKNHWLNVIRIWKNKHYNDFGIERTIRLSLALLQFLFPGLYVRHFFGKFGLLSRKLGVEIYVLFKLFLPIIFFKLNLTGYVIIAVIAGYMAIETIIYLACLVYLSNEFAKPISYRRSLTTLIINYIEIGLDYAIIYSYCNITIPNFFNVKLITDIQAVYFSFVTSATVGFGDITACHWFGQCLVVSQVILFFIFIGLFVNFFASKVQDTSYYNAKPKYPKTKNKDN